MEFMERVLILCGCHESTNIGMFLDFILKSVWSLWQNFPKWIDYIIPNIKLVVNNI